MRNLIILFSMVASTGAFADQAANWTCQGESTKLVGVTPYLGEDSSATQTLYTLSSGSYSAFFLNATARKSGASDVSLAGKNGKGGWFNLTISDIRNDGDEVIHQVGTGVISYRHGPMSGTGEKLNCVRE